jgi:hypothetical protein
MWFLRNVIGTLRTLKNGDFRKKSKKKTAFETMVLNVVFLF